jgi:hypothetical protein
MRLYKKLATTLGLISMATSAFALPPTDFKTDTLKFGVPANTTANKILEFNKGSGSLNPKLRFNPTTSKFEFSNDGSIYKALGSGTGGSGKNYITTNPDVEDGVIGGWNKGHTSLDSTTKYPTGTPTFTSGSSGTLAISASTTSPIAGLYSLLYADSAATTAGDMACTDAFTVDKEGQAKVTSWKFYYEVVSGLSNMTLSGLTTNSFGVAVYDVTNTKWVPAAGAFNIIQGSGAGMSIGTAQFDSTTTSARLCVYNANATAGAASIRFDDFIYGPQVTAAGPAIQDCKSFTMTILGATANPTKSNSPTVDVGYYCRQGDRALITYDFIASTTTGAAAGTGSYIFAPPPGLTIDTSKVTATTSQIDGTVGTASLGNTTANFWGVMKVYSSAGLAMEVGNETTSRSQVGASFQPLTTANLHYSFTASVPIVGWSSNTVNSADTDTRSVEFLGGRSSTLAITANVTDITFTSVKDSHGNWNGTQYKIPVAGDYAVAVSLNDSGATSWYASVYVNGVKGKAVASMVGGAYGSGSVLVTDLKAGDLITIRGSASTTVSADTGQHLSIFRISGSPVVQAADSIMARYSSSVAQSLSNSTTTIIDFATKSFDTTGAVTTGASWKFVAPSPGKYDVYGKICFQSNASGIREAHLYKNGSLFSRVTRAPTSGDVGCADINDTVDLLAGEFIDVRGFQNSGGALALQASASYNYITVKRSGN